MEITVAFDLISRKTFPDRKENLCKENMALFKKDTLSYNKPH